MICIYHFPTKYLQIINISTAAVLISEHSYTSNKFKVIKYRSVFLNKSYSTLIINHIAISSFNEVQSVISVITGLPSNPPLVEPFTAGVRPSSFHTFDEEWCYCLKKSVI